MPPVSSTARDTVSGIGEVVSETSKSIWIIFQDQQDRYWFGSNGQGAYCYDGKTILHFSTRDGLVNDSIRGIQEDKKGNVFFSTMGGISRFDGRSFVTLPAVESNEWRLHPDDLWFSILGGRGEYGPYRYDGTTLHHLRFPKHYMHDQYFRDFPGLPWSPYEVYTIYKDTNGNIWFGTSNFGLCRYDGKSISWLYEEPLTLVEGGGSFGIRSIIEDRQHQFWFCNTQYRYNIAPDSIVQNGKVLINYTREAGVEDLRSPGGKPFIYFMSAVSDDKGDLWMVTYREGVWQYDGKKITRHPVMDGTQETTVFSIYLDRQGTLWLGTHESGVYRFNGSTFEKFRP